MATSDSKVFDPLRSLEGQLAQSEQYVEAVASDAASLANRLANAKVGLRNARSERDALKRAVSVLKRSGFRHG